jgi:hypothetical protein
MKTTPWSDRDLSVLRQVYAQHPGPDTVPVAEIAALLGRTPAAVRTKACMMGITEPGRSREKLLATSVCPECGAEFAPEQQGKAGKRKQTCGAATCMYANRIKQGHPHPRGALGMKHTPEAKAKVSEASRRMWAAMPESEREIRAERTRLIASTRERTENTHSRGVGGRRPDLDDRYFRSRWEANYARWLNWLVAHGQITGWTYEPKTFYFPVKRGTMSYTPDFLITHTDGRQEWHEVKGWLTQQGATALRRFARYYPEEVLVLIDAPVYKSIAQQAKSLCEVWE